MNELDLVELALNGEEESLVRALLRLTSRGKLVDLSHVILPEGTRFPSLNGVVAPKGTVPVSVTVSEEKT